MNRVRLVLAGLTLLMFGHRHLLTRSLAMRQSLTVASSTMTPMPVAVRYCFQHRSLDMQRVGATGVWPHSALQASFAPPAAVLMLLIRLRC